MITYDRTADDELMDALLPGGWANSLVKFGKTSGYALDLQLRGYAVQSNGTKEKWATLYVGLTKVLDLRHLPSKGFKLRAHSTLALAKHHWDVSWEKWQPKEQLGKCWGEVDQYLERVIPSIGKAFLVEGAVQSAVSGFTSDKFLVLDREAAVTYTSNPEKKRIKACLGDPLLDSVSDLSREPFWASKPSSLGGECDVLALDQDGSLLAIEIKPRSSTTSIRWSPLQVRHYANLFSRWASDDLGVGSEEATRVIKRMVDQRHRLGLIEGGLMPHITSTIKVKPVIAIGRGYSDKALQGLKLVQQCLADSGLNDPPLQVMEAKLWGELEEISL